MPSYTYTPYALDTELTYRHHAQVQVHTLTQES